MRDRLLPMQKVSSLLVAIMIQWKDKFRYIRFHCRSWNYPDFAEYNYELQDFFFSRLHNDISPTAQSILLFNLKVRIHAFPKGI